MSVAGRMVKMVLVLLIALVVVAAVPLGWLAWRVAGSSPRISGDVQVVGVSGETVIARDEYGIPHIFGPSERDVFFALGFAHAQDRFFQMDMIRRAPQGRLAEVLGPRVVERDIRTRLMGHHEAVEASARLVDGPALRAVEAYSAGVNAALDSDAFVMPPEYTLLMAQPEPWTVKDSAAVMVYIADTLTVGQDADWDRMTLAPLLGSERFDAYVGAYPDFAPTTLKGGDLVNAGVLAWGDGDAGSAQMGQNTDRGTDENTGQGDDQGDGQAGPRPVLDPPVLRGSGAAGGGPGIAPGGPHPGSNAWVVDGSRTDSGRPLLANDPHLRYDAPAIWYLARLSLPSGEVVGATIPGAPFVIMGRNDHAAWGITAAVVDAEDVLAVPQEAIGTLAPETILVRGAEDVVVTPRAGVEGRVMEGPHFQVPQLDGYSFVLQTVVDDGDNDPSALFYALNASRSHAEVAREARLLTSPGLNFLYAERGRVFDEAMGEMAEDPARDLIAYQLLGRTPVRDGAGWWVSALHPGDNPAVVNPDGGMIVSSNNQILPGGDGQGGVPGGVLGLELGPELESELGPELESELGQEQRLVGDYSVYRATRVEDRLGRSRLHDLASFAALQGDVTSVFAARMVPYFASARPQTQAGRVVQSALSDWDGGMDLDRVQPLMFTLWLEAQPEFLWGDELAPVRRQRDDDAGFVFLEAIVSGAVGSGSLSSWCDDVETVVAEDCPTMIGRALDAAGAALFAAYGEDPAGWRWGDVRTAHFPHPLFDDVPVLSGVFSRSGVQAGHETTVNMGVTARGGDRDGDRLISRMGPQYRAIYDLSDLDASLFVVAPGQSGFPGSRHYDDLLPLWESGAYVPIPADWPYDDIPVDVQLDGVAVTISLADWVAEHAPPGSSVLALYPAGE